MQRCLQRGDDWDFYLLTLVGQLIAGTVDNDRIVTLRPGAQHFRITATSDVNRSANECSLNGPSFGITYVNNGFRPCRRLLAETSLGFGVGLENPRTREG